LVKEALEGSESADKLAGEALKDEEAETEK
jgi:hypothetical protein